MSSFSSNSCNCFSSSGNKSVISLQPLIIFRRRIFSSLSSAFFNYLDESLKKKKEITADLK